MAFVYTAGGQRLSVPDDKVQDYLKYPGYSLGTTTEGGTDPTKQVEQTPTPIPGGTEASRTPSPTQLAAPTLVPTTRSTTTTPSLTSLPISGDKSFGTAIPFGEITPDTLLGYGNESISRIGSTPSSQGTAIPSGGMVTMIAPDGQRISIGESSVQKYIGYGYKLAGQAGSSPTPSSTGLPSYRQIQQGGTLVRQYDTIPYAAYELNGQRYIVNTQTGEVAPDRLDSPGPMSTSPYPSYGWDQPLGSGVPSTPTTRQPSSYTPAAIDPSRSVGTSVPVPQTRTPTPTARTQTPTPTAVAPTPTQTPSAQVPILFNPSPIQTPSISSPTIAPITMPDFNFSLPEAGPPITIPTPTATPPPAVERPTFGAPLDQRFQDVLKQYVGNVQQQGTTELNRQIEEIFLPALKSAAAARGQIDPSGVVSGPYLENLLRLGQDAQRTTGDIVLGAQTKGLESTLGEFGRLDERSMEEYKARLQDAVSRGQLSLGQADLALRSATAQAQGQLQERLQGRELAGQAQIERMRGQLQANIAQANLGLESVKANLQAQVANGQLSIQAAQLQFQQAKEQADQIANQQALQLRLLDILGTQQLEQSRLGIQAVQGAEAQRIQQLLAMAGLGGQDLDRIIQAINAMKAGGGTTTTSQSGDLLRDIAGIGILISSITGI